MASNPLTTVQTPRKWRAFSVIYGVLAVGIFTLACLARARLPTQPFIDEDFWGYLNPALSKLNGGPFQHSEGRDFFYPGFVYLLLRGFGDFRAIPIAQHALGVLTGGLLVVVWQRGCQLLRRTPGMPVGLRLTGLVVAAAYLSARSTLQTEHSLRPEAIFPFFALLSLGLNLEFIHGRWVQPRPRATVWLGAAGVVLSATLYLIKPSFGLAIPFANAPLLASLILRGTPWRRRQATWAGGALAFSFLFLILPESLLRRNDPGVSQYLPCTLLTIHADLIYGQLGEDLAGGQPLPYPREWLEALHERLGALLAASARPENHPYPSLGFNPDYLFYTDFVFKSLIPKGPERKARIAEVSFYLYRRVVLHHPERILGKVVRQLSIFYRFESLGPGHLLDTRDRFRGEARTPVSRYYQKEAELLKKFQGRDPLARYVPARLLAEESERLTASPEQISQPPFLSVTQNVLGALYLPGLLAALGAAAWRFAAPERRSCWIVPTFTLGLAYSYNFGINLGLAIVHSLDIDRYVSNQLVLTLVASAFGLCFLGGAVIDVARFWMRPPRDTPPLVT